MDEATNCANFTNSFCPSWMVIHHDHPAALSTSCADSDIIPTMRGEGNDLDHFGSSHRLSVENDWTNGLTSRSVQVQLHVGESVDVERFHFLMSSPIVSHPHLIPPLNRLTIRKAAQRDSGSYMCAPTFAKSSSVSVHVIMGEWVVSQGAPTWFALINLFWTVKFNVSHFLSWLIAQVNIQQQCSTTKPSHGYGEDHFPLSSSFWRCYC